MFKKYPALFLLMFTVVGILLSDIVRVNSFYLLVGILVFGLIALFLRGGKRRILIPVFVGLMFLFFAAFRFAVTTYDFGQSHISNFADSQTKFTIYGKINDWVDLKDERTEMRLSVDSLKADRVYYVHGNLLIRLNVETTSFQRNDKLILEGRIYPIKSRTFSADFDYHRFLSYKGITGVVYLNTDLQILLDKGNRYSLFVFTDRIRNWIRQTFYDNLDEEAAALASGFLIGETRDISPELYQRFKDSGTLHLLAVSGSNVVLVIGFFLYLFRPFSLSKRKRTILLLAVLVIFVLLSYEEPSVIRASVMAGLVLLAGLFERRYDLNNIIALSALIILIAVPSQLFNIGFQLSFIIAWGLIVTMPQIAILFDRYKNKNWYRFLVFPFLVSLVAQIFSTGLIGLYFDRIPVLSPFANLIIVPLVSVAVIGIQILLAANFLLPILGKFIGALLVPVFKITIGAVNLFGGEGMLFFNSVNWQIGYVVLFYLLLFYLSLNLQNKKARRVTLIAASFLTIIAQADSLYSKHQASSETSIEVLSIPGGSVTIFQNSNESADIVIHGMSARKYPVDEKILIPEFARRSIRKIDKIFILSVEYHAIDDVLRLANRFKAEDIYYKAEIENPLTEVCKQHGLTFPGFVRLIPTMDRNNDGFIFLHGELCFKLKQNTVRFIDSLTYSDILLFSEGLNIIVFDKDTEIELDTIHSSSKIICICANSEQKTVLQTFKSSLNTHLEIYLLHDSEIPVYKFPQ
ncbi:MAG: ComEC family competence protein [Calditrichaeota bacterium]|nr:MAG: ComEC family competence protein [Calditrichota bacterium]